MSFDAKAASNENGDGTDEKTDQKPPSEKSLSQSNEEAKKVENKEATTNAGSGSGTSFASPTYLTAGLTQDIWKSLFLYPTKPPEIDHDMLERYGAHYEINPDDLTYFQVWFMYAKYSEQKGKAFMDYDTTLNFLKTRPPNKTISSEQLKHRVSSLMRALPDLETD